jgi:hypothetical protein
VIWDIHRDEYLPVPMKEMWNNVAEYYANRWNFQNCTGCIDGKHVAIKCPARSGSKFYNLKTFSPSCCRLLLTAIPN